MPDSRNPNVKIHPPGTYGNPGGGYYGDGGYGGGGGGGGYGGGDDAYTLREKLRKAEEELRTLKEEPKLVATVVEIRGDHMLISFGPGNSVYVHTFAGARVGDRAICHRNSMQVTETIRDPFPTGEILSVVRVEGDVIEGERLGVPCVFRGQGRKVLQGERVVLDASSTFVIGSLGMPHSNYARAPKVSVAWDDIGGQDEAKDALREAIELPLSHPKLFAAYGKRASKGVLLAGSSGLGKTLIAKAAATSIAKAHGQDASSGFIYVKGPELLAKWVGQSEEAVRNLFTAARKHFAEHGYPALVFLDECDSLLGARQNGGIHSIGTTLVPQFLAEMDGFDATGALFILATNRPDMLDPAVTREGRIDRKIVLRRPTQLELVRIAEIHLRSKPTAEEGLPDQLAALIFQPGRLTLDLGAGRVIELADHASGALVEGIVDKATTAAIIRDITRGKKQVSGITAADLAFAVDRVQAELRATDQREVMAEVIARIEQEALGQPAAAPP